jgi:hypothetical protein
LTTISGVHQDKRRALLEDGYCVFTRVLPPDLLAQLRRESARRADARLEQDREKHRSTGSMINIMELPQFAELLTLPAALEALRALGYGDPRFTSGYVISKPPHSPRLFWHYDWACWDDPGAFGEVPQQLFLMYYLVDTTPHNGCLRVIPGSHRQDNPLHALLAEAHTDELLSAKNLERAEYQLRPDEVDVPVKAGDLVIGDSRLLHASHANDSDERRTVLTLWFHPDMAALDEGTQGFIAGMAGTLPTNWPADTRARVEPFMAAYEGTATPLKWNRHRPSRST